MGMEHVKGDRFEKAPQGKDRALEWRSKECSRVRKKSGHFNRDGESAVRVGGTKNV